MEYYLSDDITPAPPAIGYPVPGSNMTLLPGGEVHAAPSGYVTVEGGGEVRVPGGGYVTVEGAGEVRIYPGPEISPQIIDAAHFAEVDTGYVLNEVV
ncbi:hypothetical protein GGQ74_000970 [Desulfobaculum xiamenense]|uniref:Uncharacterized protein n=1 Tax=Desulfobaculum xiamenense TaxID=995050 RepID=A0A846QJT8_9BACT|nr:hypothetical protein [Desulfobaculum xiamenense]NJB67330.1 hypothetical protein [Desulfobaculum xiamenense]